MKKQLYNALLISGLLAGCAKEQTPAPGSAASAGTPVTITAAVDADTRSSLGGDGRSVSWSKGDKIAVYSQVDHADGASIAVNDGYQMEFTLDEASAGNASGQFGGTLIYYDKEAELTAPSYTLHAYYPFSAANAKNKKFAVAGTLPAVQACDMKGTYDLSAYDFLVAEAKGVKSSDVSFGFTFKRVFAMMQFQITNATGESFSVRKVEMSAAGKALAGEFKIKVHRNLNVVPDTEPGESNGNDGRPWFLSGSESVAVSVEQGLLGNGATGTVRAMFNRWEDLKNTDLTVTVTTNKGTFTKVLNTGERDFSLKDNYLLAVNVDQLTPLSTDPVDNYVEGSMTLVNANVANTAIQAGGTFCIDGDIRINNDANVAIRNNVTITGRHTVNGVPQDRLTAAFASNSGTPAGVSIVFKDLIISPVGGVNANRYIIRSNNPGADIESITFENCIIEYTGAYEQDYLLLLHHNQKVIKNMTVKNCIIRNLSKGLITYAGATETAQANIGSIRLIDNTIYADAATTAEYFRFCGGQVEMRNNTFYNYASAEGGALISVTAGNVECSKNIFHAPTSTLLFGSTASSLYSAQNNCLYNTAVAAGNTEGTTDPQFTNPTTDFTPQNQSVIDAEQGDMRWL